MLPKTQWSQLTSKSPGNSLFGRKLLNTDFSPLHNYIFENIFYLDNNNLTEAPRIFLLVLKYLFTLQLQADLDDIKIGQ